MFPSLIRDRGPHLKFEENAMVSRRNSLISFLSLALAFGTHNGSVHAGEGPFISITTPTATAPATPTIPTYGGSVAIGGNVGGLQAATNPTVYVQIFSSNSSGYTAPGASPLSTGFATGPIVAQLGVQAWTATINSPNYGAGYWYLITATVRSNPATGPPVELTTATLLVKSQ
jgi:hypothetical protein